MAGNLLPDFSGFHMISHIYKITHIASGRAYIGLTTRKDPRMRRGVSDLEAAAALGRDAMILDPAPACLPVATPAAVHSRARENEPGRSRQCMTDLFDSDG
jgi:hypothetical protein